MNSGGRRSKTGVLNGEVVTERQLVCTYGRAQKLVDIYLKSKVVCAGWETHPSVATLHPPVDGVLLKAMR